MKNTHRELTEDFMRVWGQVKANLMDMADAQGLTFQQTSALYVIREQGSLPMNALATWLRCDASNVTGIVDRLVHQGLVERREDAEDRRAKVLSLTDKGSGLINTLAESLPHKMGFDRLDDNECRLLSAILAKLPSRATLPK